MVGRNFLSRAASWWRRRQIVADEDGKVSILLAQLEGDDDQCSRRAAVALAIERRFGTGLTVTTWPEPLCLQEGSKLAREAAALQTASTWLRQTGCSALVWGHVKGQRALALRISTERALGMERTYTLSEIELEVADLLPEDVAAGVIAEIISDPGVLLDLSVSTLQRAKAKLEKALTLDLDGNQRLPIVICHASVMSLLGDFLLSDESLRNARKSLAEARSLLGGGGPSVLVANLDIIEAQMLVRSALAQGDMSALQRAVNLAKRARANVADSPAAIRAQISMMVADLLFSISCGKNMDFQILTESRLVAEEVVACIKPTDYPQIWAGARQTAGRGMVVEGLFMSDVSMLEKAVNAFKEASTVLDRAESPCNWAWIQRETGYAYFCLFERTKNVKYLRSASIAYQTALSESAFKERPAEFAMCQIHLALSLAHLFAENEEDNLLVQALRLCLAADTSGYGDYDQLAAAIKCYVYALAGLSRQDTQAVDTGLEIARQTLEGMSPAASEFRRWTLHSNIGFAHTLRWFVSSDDLDRRAAVKSTEEALTVARRMKNASIEELTLDVLSQRKKLLYHAGKS